MWQKMFKTKLKSKETKRVTQNVQCVGRMTEVC